MATFAIFAAFVGNFGFENTLDAERTGSLGAAIAIDLGLIILFCIQHSVMARPGFKKAWIKIVPVSTERATYCLFSSAALLLLIWQWRPLGGPIWNVDGMAQAVLYSVYAVGWFGLVGVTFLLNHFDLFGLRQVWMRLRGQEITRLRFAEPGPYSVVRHPLYVGWITIFWATPTMTASHLFMALCLTVYILIAIVYEERDLVTEHGESYNAYRRRVPKLIPRLGKPKREDGVAEVA
jgi:protein-S-isoprenylcysteine O-methyltransferase Ste14